MPDNPNFGISKTIPKSAGRAALESLYDGSVETYEFHLNSNLKRVNVGDWVYTIFDHQLHGRCRIVSLEPGHVNPCSGQPRTFVFVSCPGERLAEPIAMKGHQGTRYYEGDAWPG